MITDKRRKLYCVYLLKCKKIGGNVFYIGCTGSLRRRMIEHKNGEVKTTKGRDPKLIYFEAFNNRELAFERERRLKTSGSVYNALLRRLKLKSPSLASDRARIKT